MYCKERKEVNAKEMAEISVMRYVGISALLCYVTLFQVQSVSSQGDLASGQPMLPFCISVPGGLQIDQIIKITGFAVRSTGSSIKPAPWLNVILSSECTSRLTPFHLRMQETGNGTTVVGNAFSNGHWGEEMSGPRIDAFSQGQFVLLVEIRSEGYRVSGNGISLWTLPHRLSYADITKLSVKGESADIRKIELIDQSDPDPQRNTMMFYPVPLEQPVRNPTFPFWGAIPGGLKAGKAIRIKGVFLKGAWERKRTSIDLCQDRFNGPVMLHVDIRFKFSVDIQRVVRNFYKDKWISDTEERDGPFPFKFGEKFTMLIEVQPHYYNFSVNGIPYWTYNHKLPFIQATQLTIVGSPAVITEVAYIDAQEKVKTTSEKLVVRNGAMGTLEATSRVLRTGIYIAVFVLVRHLLPMM